MVENIIPYIGGEEEKSEQEPLRVLGTYENGQITLADAPKITCQCLRCAGSERTYSRSIINFEKKPTKEQLIEKLGKLQRISAGGRIFQVHQSSLSATWKRITVHR